MGVLFGIFIAQTRGTASDHLLYCTLMPSVIAICLMRY